MVAASTHERDLSAHSAREAPARITASSHGCFISNVDAHAWRRDSGSCLIASLAAGQTSSWDRKVRITQLDPVVTLEFHEISNSGGKLPSQAIEFDAFLKNVHRTPRKP
jgi:hypothetical protein